MERAIDLNQQVDQIRRLAKPDCDREVIISDIGIEKLSGKKVLTVFGAESTLPFWLSDNNATTYLVDPRFSIPEFKAFIHPSVYLANEKELKKISAEPTRLPFDDNTFDFVTGGSMFDIMSQSNSHVWLKDGIEEVLRVMRRGGTFVATGTFIPEDESPWESIKEENQMKALVNLKYRNNKVLYRDGWTDIAPLSPHFMVAQKL